MDNDKSNQGQDSMQREAFTWLVRLTSGEATQEDAAALAAWRARSGAHDAAFRQAARLWRALDPAARSSAAVAVAASPAKGPLLSRRRLGQGALAAGLAGLALAGGRDLWPLLRPAGDLHTAVGEQRDERLADGSQVLLNTATALRLDFTADARRVELLRGEALFTVTPDGARPFTVQAGRGSVTALGTVFAVRQLDGGARVTCLDGTIAVRCGGEAVLTAGQEVTYGDSLGPVATVDPDQAAAWRKGLLYFRAQPLAEVVAEIGRYRPGPIILANEAAAARQVSGVFHLARPDEALAHIGRTLSLDLERLPGGIVLLR